MGETERHPNLDFLQSYIEKIMKEVQEDLETKLQEGLRSIEEKLDATKSQLQD